MKVTHESWIVLSFDGVRSPVRARKIGKGRWSTAYHDAERGDVYLFTRIALDGGTDYAKEMLSHLSDAEKSNPHIPLAEREEDIDGSGVFRVYRMPFYGPLTAKSGKAWRQFKQLHAVAEETHSELLNREQTKHGNLNRFVERGDEFTQLVIDRFRGVTEATPELVAALEILRDATLNYGRTWWFEFAKRNCRVNAEGQLVLLDCLYSREQLERERR